MRKRMKTRRFLSMLLSVMMVFSLFTGTVSAAELPAAEPEAATQELLEEALQEPEAAVEEVTEAVEETAEESEVSEEQIPATEEAIEEEPAEEEPAEEEPETSEKPADVPEEAGETLPAEPEESTEPSETETGDLQAEVSEEETEEVSEEPAEEENLLQSVLEEPVTVEAEPEEISVKPESISYRPTQASNTAYINELTSFDPDKTEYHVLHKSMVSAMSYVKVSHKDENAKVSISFAGNIDSVSSPVEKTVEGSANQEIRLTAFMVKAGDTGRIRVTVTSQGESTAYTIYVHVVKFYPLQVPYTWNDGQNLCENPTVIVNSSASVNSTTVYVDPDTPDDAALQVSPQYSWGVTCDWDGKVILKDGRAEVPLKVYPEGNLDVGIDTTIFFERDTNTSLKSLSYEIGGTTVNTEVFQGRLFYSGYLPDGTEDGTVLKVTAAADSTTATVSCESGTVKDGKAEATVTVTAGDGKTSETYTVRLFMPVEGDNSLSALEIYRGGNTNVVWIESNFDSGVAEYVLDVPYEQYDSVRVWYLPSDPAAKVLYSYIDPVSGTPISGELTGRTSGDKMIRGDLLDYYGEVKLTVVPENGQEKTYTIRTRNTNKELSGDASLTALRYEIPGEDQAKGIPGFDKEKYEYTVELPFGTRNVTLLPTYSNQGTICEESMEVSIIGEQTDAVLHLTAANGAKEVYTVHFVTEMYSTYLNSLSYQIGNEELTEIVDFDKKTTSYKVILAEGIQDGTSVSLTGAPESEGAKTETYPVIIQNGSAKAVITVSDGEESRTYAVYFYVGAVHSEANELAGLELTGTDVYSSDLADGFVPSRTDYTVTLYREKAEINPKYGAVLKAVLPEGSEAAMELHYHSDEYNAQCNRISIENGQEYELKSLISGNVCQNVTIKVIPKEGECKTYTITVRSYANPVSRAGFALYEPQITGEAGQVIHKGGWNMFATHTDRTFYIPYESGLKENETLKVWPNANNYLLEPEMPVYTVQLQGREATLPMKFTNQKGETQVNTYKFYLMTEEECNCTLQYISYSIEDGENIEIPLDSFSKSVISSDTTNGYQYRTTVILPENVPENAVIQLYGVKTGGTKEYSENVTLKNGQGTAYLTCASSATTTYYGRYEVNFNLQSPTPANAFLSGASYQIDSGTSAYIENFHSNRFDYQVLLPEDTKDGAKVSVTGITRYKGAIISGDTEAMVENGMASVALTVTSADEMDSNEYIFTFAHDFEKEDELGFKNLTYTVGSSDTRHHINGFSSACKTLSVILPIDTPDDSTVTFYPEYPDNMDVILDGDTVISLKDGAAQAVFKLSLADGARKTITVDISKEGPIMSVFGYLPIGSQYTNKGFGTKPILYQEGMKLIAPSSNWGNCQSVGNFGGYMAYKLTKPLKNDPANPYGVDFIVYGNGQGGENYVEPGAVWVAQDKDGDGQPDAWYELAGSAHYEASTVWNYQITYRNENGGTGYETSDGRKGNISGYEYPDIDRYGYLGTTVDPEETIVTGTKLSDDIIPIFGYGDVHPNDAGPIEEPLNPYRAGELFGGFSNDYDAINHGVSRGDAMDISWAVDTSGNPVELDEISFIKVVNASFVQHSAFGERSAEIACVVPLYGNHGKEAVGNTDELNSIILTDGTDTITIPFTAGKYTYDIDVPSISNYRVKVEDNVKANVYLNNSRSSQKGYALSNAKEVSPGSYVVRMIVQEGEKEPIIYYLTFHNQDDIKYTVDFNANGGNLDGNEIFRKGYGESDIGKTLPIPERLRYEFQGWYAGNTRYETVTADMPETLVLAAKWKYVGMPETEEKLDGTFRLIGATKSSVPTDFSTGSGDSKYVTWIATQTYEMNLGSSVYDLFRAAMDGKLEYEGVDTGYISAIHAPEVLGGYILREMTNGKRSGWMYTVNGKHPTVGFENCILNDGDAVIWHYVNDYSYEVEDWFSDDAHPALGNESTWNGWLKAADVNPVTPTNPVTPEKPTDPTTPTKPVTPEKPAAPEIGSVHKAGKLQYKILDSGNVEVNKITDKNAKSLTVPDTVKIEDVTFIVTSIGSKAFKDCRKLQTVTLGKNIRTISSEAFSGCKALTKVKGASGVTAVNTKAFYKCTKLKTIGSKSSVITLSKVKTIGSSAFSGCTAIKKVNVSSSALTKIGTKAFYKCTSMTSFTASSKKLASIGNQAFYGDKKLASVTLKTTKLTKSKVGSSAFKGIKNTCKFKVPSKKVSSYKSILKARGAGSKIKVTK